MSRPTSNLAAFLRTISVSEGTAGIGEDGYNVLVGSSVRMPILFCSYHDHPRIRVQLRPSLVSTAAGRYQILVGIFDAYRKPLGVTDFSPAAQDAIAKQLIRERRALEDVEAGRFDVAVVKVKGAWASLPGAGYGQFENSLADLREVFISSGGRVA